MNPADVLRYGHERVLKTVSNFPEAEWQTGGVCGVWSSRDIISHLASYEHWLTEILMPFAGQESDNACMNAISQHGIAAFNDDQVAARRHKTPAQVLEEYQQTYARAAALVPIITPETWRQPGTLPWYGAEYALDDFIVYSFYGHKCEHCAQIAVFLDQLKTASGE